MKEPHAVIREGAHSDHRYPDLGQQLTWQHTTALAEEACGECGQDITQIGQGECELVIRGSSVR
jgi:hypothetical protein